MEVQWHRDKFREMAEKISMDDILTVHYWKNPRWGHVAEEMVFKDGSKAIEEE